MKVAMLGWEYPPFKVGGLGTHCYGLTRGLADQHVTVDFYMPRTKTRAYADKEGVNVIEVGHTSVFPYSRPDDKELNGNFFECVHQYNELLKTRVKGDYDLIHCHDWLTMEAAIHLKEELNIPLVLTVHSTEYDRSGWLNPNQWFIDIERQGMQKADKIIAVSHFTKRVCVERYGINPDKITVVHNAVYPLGEGPKKDLVLFLGRLTIQKGPEFFLKAAKKVLDHNQNVRFVVAGKGEMLPRLIDQAVELGISKNIIFTGRLTEEEVRHIYQISKVYIMPSVSEPFGITALEAISAGTPTILSKTAGVAEAFTNALKVDFWDTDEMANKILALLKYDALHNTITQNSKKELELFTWDRTAQQTVSVYNEVR